MISLKKRYWLSSSFFLNEAGHIYNILFEEENILIYDYESKKRVARISKQDCDFFLSGNHRIQLLYGFLKKENSKYICEYAGINTSGYFSSKLSLPFKASNDIELLDIVIADDDEQFFIKIEEEKKAYWIQVSIVESTSKLVEIPIDTVGISFNGNALTISQLKQITEYKNLNYDDSFTCKYSGNFAVLSDKNIIYIFDCKQLLQTIQIKNYLSEFEIVGDKLYVVEIENARSKLSIYDLKEAKKIEVAESLGRMELAFPSQDGYTVKLTYLVNGVSFYNCSVSSWHLIKRYPYSDININVDRSLFDSEHMYTFILSDANRKSGFIGNIFSFHGGPESYEQLDDRWLGEYIRYISLGYRIFIVNYPGSRSFGLNYLTLPWKNWSKKIDPGIKNLVRTLIEQKKVSFKYSYCFGGSFGAPIAYKMANYLSNNTLFQGIAVVLVSPLIDLEEHINKLQITDRKWFDKRFSKKDIEYLSINQEKHIPKFKIYCYQSINDEILTFKSTEKYILQLKKHGYKSIKFVAHTVMKHAPQNFEEEKNMLDFIRTAIVGDLDNE